jgi:RNA polymerase sigma-70 factor (ECF subfamily)
VNPPPDEKSFTQKRAREERWRHQMEAAQDGDQAAYASLLKEVMPLLRNLVRHRRHTPEDVDDIVQDVLLSLHAVRHTYDPARPFVPWLLAIARRRIADAARRSSSRSRHETAVDVLPETFPAYGAKIEQETRDEQAAIQQALAGLTRGQREAIELVKLQGLSIKEASGLSGRTGSSLKLHVHRALKALRRSMTAKT